MIQVELHQIREHLDEIGAALAAGDPVRIVDGTGNLIRDLPDDIAGMIESAKLSHMSRRSRVAPPNVDHQIDDEAMVLILAEAAS